MSSLCAVGGLCERVEFWLEFIFHLSRPMPVVYHSDGRWYWYFSGATHEKGHKWLASFYPWSDLGVDGCHVGSLSLSIGTPWDGSMSGWYAALKRRWSPESVVLHWIGPLLWIKHPVGVFAQVSHVVSKLLLANGYWEWVGVVCGVWVCW